MSVATVKRAKREHMAGRLAPAERLYRDALADEPGNVEAMHLLGLVQLQQGDVSAALPLLEQSAQRAPGEADYHNRHGAALAAAGRDDDAIVAYRHAISCRPDHPEAHNNLAILFAATGDWPGAIESYRTALSANPGLAEAHNGLAVALAETAHLADAEHHYRRALDIRPAYVEARTNLGNLLARLGRFEDAIAALRAALDIAPARLEALLCLTDTLARAGDIESARMIATQALDSYPNLGRAHNCYGMICRQAGDLQAASTHLARAIELDPALAEAHGNRALVLLATGRIEGATAAAERAVALAPGSDDHRMNLGMIWLLRGEFERGFAGYRARFDSRQSWVVRRSFSHTPWSGQALDGRTVLAWGEQGVGEEIMLASLLDRLDARAGRCLVECDPRLVPILRRSFSGIEVHGRADPARDALGDPAIDMTLGFGDIASALGLGLRDFADPVAYLRADEAAREAARHRLAALGDGLKVGVSWRSRGANAAFNAEKSTTLEDWYAILGVAGTCFVDLQYGDTSADVAHIAERLGVDIVADHTVDQMRDLDGFAALIDALDLIITTSNTTAHLAGALGKEVWVLLPHVPDWRWQLSRGDSVWYPRTRLIRQPVPGDWRGVLGEAAAALVARTGA